MTGSRASQKRTRINGKRTGVAGWEFVHVCVDDATRLAYVEVLENETGLTAVGFLRRAIAFYRRHGITVERVMTDNGSAYRSTIHAVACHSASATSGPGPTGPAPTAKPSASSAPCSTAGPTAPSIAQAPNAQPPLTAGSGTTTIDVDTQPSAASRPSAGPTCSGPTPRRGWRNVSRRRDARVVPRPGRREPRVILNVDALGRAARLRRHR